MPPFMSGRPDHFPYVLPKAFCLFVAPITNFGVRTISLSEAYPNIKTLEDDDSPVKQPWIPKSAKAR
jgi:hypothetical protein